MRLRNITGSEELIMQSHYVITEPEQYKGKWNSYFQNVNPIPNMKFIYIEIGMGKGQFITEMAIRHPEICFIGIEMYSSVLYRAVKKIERISPKLDNLVLLRMDARDLTAVFGKGEVSRIYLNFSDPWPKDRHAKRRIIHRNFLRVYDDILMAGGRVEFKTDNADLFHFALAERQAIGWKLDQVSYNLHSDNEMMRNNVFTEYEEKFSALGNPIFKYVISR